MDENEQRAAMARRLDRLTAALAETKQQRNALATKLADATGTRWEDELAAVGVDLGTARDQPPFPDSLQIP